jgi:hypothetical protein
VHAGRDVLLGQGRVVELGEIHVARGAAALGVDQRLDGRGVDVQRPLRPACQPLLK